MKSFKSFLMSESDPGISKTKETQFHASLDKLVHKTFGKRKNENVVQEDGMGAGAVASGPTNTTGGGQVAGMGEPPRSKSGEPGVYLKKKKAYNPIMMGMGSRKPPKV
jgi:hypothetical protein